MTSLTDVHTWSLDDDVLDALVTARRARLRALVRCAVLRCSVSMWSDTLRGERAI